MLGFGFVRHTIQDLAKQKNGASMSDTNPPAQDLHILSNFDLFHRLWSKAVDSPRYNKQEWMAMEERLLKAGFLRNE
jgi:hypothetical protein